MDKFEVGKVYKYNNGIMVHVLVEVQTTANGSNQVLLAETTTGVITPLGTHPGSFDGWQEVPLSNWYAHWLVTNKDSQFLQKKLKNARIDEINSTFEKFIRDRKRMNNDIL
jgi:hypothetical protein